jgi:hypothetical protein
MTFDLLKADDIEIKCSEVKEKGFIALLYKNARTDQKAFDKKFGVEGWQDEYREIKGVLYCGISVFINDKWITKWDCGIESRADDKGNEKKGEASDAFKRAATKWGHGRELYTAPFIYIATETVPDKKIGDKQTYRLKDKYETYFVKEISYTDDEVIKTLKIVNSKGTVVYSSDKPRKPKSELASVNKQVKQPVKETATEKTQPQTSKFAQINNLIKNSKFNMENVKEWIVKKYKKNIRVNSLTDEQFKELFKSLESAIKKEGGKNE